MKTACCSLEHDFHELNGPSSSQELRQYSLGSGLAVGCPFRLADLPIANRAVQGAIGMHMAQD